MFNSVSANPFLQRFFPAGLTQPDLVPGVTASQVQDFAFLFAELQEVPASPFLQTVEDPLNDSRTV